MPEENQIQPGFQPENKANSQIQQNNLIQSQQQNQESTQQIIQQDNPIQNQQPVQGISQQIIQQSTQQNTEKPVQTIYYHPTRLTKILSGIYRFLGIVLIRAGLRNFSLIGTEDLSFLKILYVGGVISLCGILYLLLGRLLYNTRSRVHLGFSLLGALIVNIMFARILMTFSNNSYGIDSDMLESLGILNVAFTLIYFSISTIRWIIKWRRFKKKGIINSKYLSSTPSKKKVGIVITILLFSIIIINFIYGKFQWSKIPEIDESIFQRSEHQTPLPDDEDAIYQLKTHNDGNINHILVPLDSYFHNINNSSYGENNKDISRKNYTNECIVVNSGGNQYCGTRAWNRNTLDRVLNNYYYINDSYMKDLLDSDGYLSVDGKKVTILEYINKYEAEIRSELKELDRISSLDYYLPDDEILELMPQYFQSFSRVSTILIEYYIYQEDWNMVMFIIQLNYKIIDILNDTGSIIYQLISLVLQGIIDSNVNSYIQLFPKDFRNQLAEQYSTQIHDKDEIIDKTMKGEYVIRNWAKNGNIMGETGKDTPSLFQFLFHFPFYSENEINRLMVYSYYEYWNRLKDKNKDFFLDENFSKPLSLYNMFGMYPFYSLTPRVQSINDRINSALYHKEAIIKNLKSGKYDVRFSEKDWDSYEYERNRIPTNNELSK